MFSLEQLLQLLGLSGVVVGPSHGPQITSRWKVESTESSRSYTGIARVQRSGNGDSVAAVAWKIVEWNSFPTELYICNPPRELREHPKGHCLQLLSPDSSWFKMHWMSPAPDFVSARNYLEQMLEEAFCKRQVLTPAA